MKQIRRFLWKLRIFVYICVLFDNVTKSMGEQNTKGKRGGSRPGAGRKGKVSGTTKVVRIPEAIADQIGRICDVYEEFVEDPKKKTACRKQMIAAIDEMFAKHEIKKEVCDRLQLSIEW